MIKRSAARPSDSLVSDAKVEHYSVVQGIRTDAPLTNNTSVIKSVNFENDRDGSYILRKPLIKKEDVSKDTWYLYDQTHILSVVVENGEKHILIDPNVRLYFTYYDSFGTLHAKVLELTDNKDVSWITKINSVNTEKDHTLLSVKINPETLSEFIQNNTNITEEEFKIIHDDLHYGNSLYRFLKIYKDTSTLEDIWICELVYPEYNSFTAALDVGNSEALETNLVLDNPYAVRDLYGYGYISTTKILGYESYYGNDDVSSLRVCDLTEDVMYIENNTLKGFKLIVSASPRSINRPVFLKAFLTSAKTDGIYYCCWEESSNGGVDWKVCPDFISKFNNNEDNPIVEIKVSDLTNEAFDKLAYQESLDQAANYLVTKQVVRLNYKKDASGNLDLNELDLISDRPDVLTLNAADLNKLYRFQIYMDTRKTTPKLENITRTVSTYFELSTEGDIDDNISYSTYRCSGKVNSPETNVEGSLYTNMFNGESTFTDTLTKTTTNIGNSIVFKAKNDYLIKKVSIRSGSLELPESLESTDYYKFVCKADEEISTGKAISEITTGEDVQTISKNTVLNVYTHSDESTLGIEKLSFVMVGETTAFKNSEDEEEYTDCKAKLLSATITYTKAAEDMYTSIYLASTTGAYQVPYSDTTVYPADLSIERKNIFEGTFYNPNLDQYLVFAQNKIYVSSLDSSIFKLLNSISFGTDVTSVIAWRSYLIAFTEKDISLMSYDNVSDTYNVKLISTSIGLPKIDAKTPTVILNSIYFKSGYHVYKLVPNLYASLDNILNLHIVNTEVEGLFEDIISNIVEVGNFQYTDAETYRIFIPTNSEKTYCFIYHYEEKLWNLLEYPVTILSVEHHGLNEAYLKTTNKIYYFKESLTTLLNTLIIYDFQQLGYIDASDPTVEYKIVGGGDGIKLGMLKDDYERLSSLYNYIPYTDFLNDSLLSLYTYINEHKDEQTYSFLEDKESPIMFEINFGQKSSNYTFDKQYLETKFLFGTLQRLDTFPVHVEVFTDGIEHPLVWDVNTNSSLWKNNLNELATLNTDIYPQNIEYDGIVKQLIVKYSGRGKTIKHKITGNSKSNFKFYAMNVKSRILPKKQ